MASVTPPLAPPAGAPSQHTGSRNGAPITGTLAVVAAAIALLPLLYLIIVIAGDPGAALEPLRRDRAWVLLGNSVALAGAVTASCAVLALTLALLIERTDVRGRGFWRVVTVVPLALPSYVAAYLVISALGPRGEVATVLGTELPSIYGFGAAWLTLTLVSYPYVLLPVSAALRGLDPALEEASRSLGHGPMRTLVRVVLPQLRPALGAGSLLVALYVLSDFGAVALSRYDTFTRAIFTSYQASFDRSGAAGLAAMLVALTAVVVWLESRSHARGALARGARAAGRRSAVRELGRCRPAALGILAAITTVTVAMPLAMLGIWVARAAATDIDGARLLEAAGGSLTAALLAAAVATLMALPIALYSVRSGGLLARLTERAAYLGHALPGIVVALAMVFLTLRAVPFIYQTLAALTLALAILFLPQALGPQRATLLQLSPRVPEAARSLGSGPAALLVRVLLPLMRRGLLAGAILVFLTAVKELPATLILSPPEFPTLATTIWTQASTSAYEDAALPSLILLLLGSLPVAYAAWREARP